MNSKWYISTFIILLALLGLSQEQTKVANQQIVVQFSDSDTTCDDALAIITKRLQALGVTNIEIVESVDTKLTFRYYSDNDTRTVGEFLSQDGRFSLTYDGIGKLPFDAPDGELPESYSLVISDLQQNTGDDPGSNGKFAFELRQDYQLHHNPVVVYCDADLALGQNISTKVAYKVHQVIAIAIDHTSGTIPEVRAGPRV